MVILSMEAVWLVKALIAKDILMICIIVCLPYDITEHNDSLVIGIQTDKALYNVLILFLFSPMVKSRLHIIVV